ncbi:uncharacterized protein P884DRAFT_265013 [Thermothelomyces heterothallicus CBS 202.75]|uniref:uncharacterized protein n=1 Tax=Thermothelomyces heterothallicus CBS 202.75 TaxID=1149848 RepID=UPI003744ABD2
MQKTRALGSLKDLFPRLHQPLPLDKRESQRLLDTIKASFRKQLDEEHGWTVSDSGKDSPRLKLATVHSRTGTVPSTAPARPTDRHMRAILDNPLFTRVEVPKRKEESANSLDAHKAVFRKAVSRGLVTLNTAQGFLMHIESVAFRLRPENTAADGPWLRNQLQDTGAGLLVLQWLRSSGQERDLKFLTNANFTNILARFLVAEGLDDVVLMWFERLLKPGSERTEPEFQTAKNLLGRLVYAKQARNLESAYTTILKAAAIAEEKSCPPAVVKYAWCILANETSMHHDKQTMPPAHIYDAFVALGRKLNPGAQFMAQLSLRHPVEPTSGPAVEFLQSKSAWRVNDAQNPVTLRYLRHVHRLAVDTAQYLTQTNQAEEASRLFNFVREKISMFTDPNELDLVGDLEPA